MKTFTFPIATLSVILLGCQDGSTRPAAVQIPKDPSCPPMGSLSSASYVAPDLLNRSAIWDAAQADYAKTNQKTEAVVDVYAVLDTIGVPMCAAPERVAGDVHLSSIAVSAALMSRWKPAVLDGRAIKSTVHLGFALCKSPAIQTEQHRVWCAPPLRVGGT